MKNKKTKEEVFSMRNFKNNKGITLIALVITVIMLMILATIGIGQITDENGIIRKAFTSKDKQQTAEDEEKSILNEIGIQDDGGSIGIGEAQPFTFVIDIRADNLTYDGITLPYGSYNRTTFCI